MSVPATPDPATPDPATPDQPAERDVDPDLEPAFASPASAPPLPAVLAAVAAGGVLGAEARYGLARAVTHRPDEWPWATLVTNVAGCLLIGLLMAVIQARRTPPLLRPFVGVGVLGGFTTFSTFALDAHSLSRDGRQLVALSYLLVSLAGCLIAVAAGVRAGGRLVGRPR